MNINCVVITNPEEKIKVESKIIDEWEHGILHVFKKISPNAKVDVSLPNKAASQSNECIDYWCNILNDNDDLIGRFSIIGEKINVSNLVIKGT
jgi:hypothetical protein